MFPSVTMVAILTVLSTLAAARRPARCVGGGDQLTVCVETPIQPRRYDNGGLYGAEYWRRKYGGGRGYGHTATRYDYRVQTKPLYDQEPPVYRPAPPVYIPAPPVYRPQPPVYHPVSPPFHAVPIPVFRPSRPIPIDYGFEGRTGYGAPSGHDGHVEYAGRARYAGGFRPVVVEQRTYHDEHHSQPGAHGRPFIHRPHVTGPHSLTPHADIRTFYRGASMLGQGQISTDGRNNVQFVCDFTLAGVSPTTDVLTDVVWQKVGRPAYMNNPMTSVSGYPNLLNCPNTYVSSTPTNYGFNIAGPKTTLVIKNATAADYGVYRCYATKVSRQTPRQRTPVYMEVYYGPSGASGRH